MIGRENFTTPQWIDMQMSIKETPRYLILSHPGFFEDLKDSFVTKRVIKNFADNANSELIDDLLDFDNYKSPIPEYARDTSEGIEPQLLRAITNSVALLILQDQNSALLFKDLVTKIANSILDADKHINPTESVAYQNILNALEAEPEPIVKEWDPKNPLAPSK